MFRFGLRMTLRNGRESLVRLLVTTAAVALGVGLLLSVLGMYHAYQSTVDRPCWECTHSNATPETAKLLWRDTADVYAGRNISRLDVATLTADAPVLPGLSHMPAPGRYYASPAMEHLLATVPADELGDRYPGTFAGTVGPAALNGPDQLVIVIGRTRAEMIANPQGAQAVSTIDMAPHDLSTSQFYKFGFALGAVALLVPMLVLIGTATRMAAARREERYAAMRLVGATRGQISVVASVDAVVGAVFGALLGLGVYAALHPLLSELPLLGFRFFADRINPTTLGVVAVLVVLPLAAAVACLGSLRRVGITPLGVSRRVTPPAPRAWRAIPLVIGLGLFCVPLLSNPAAQRHSPGGAVLSLILVMAGLMFAGPWLTMWSARILARVTGGGSSLLAARRLADNPRAAFRSVSGLVLAVMVGTALASLVPAAVASENTTADAAIDNVLRVHFPSGPDDAPQAAVAAAAAAITQIDAIPGAKALPFYAAPGTARPGKGTFPEHPPLAVIPCDTLRELPIFGTCPAGATAALADTGSIFTDNIGALNNELPFVTTDSQTTTADPASLPVQTLLVTTDSAATLEKVRTVLTSYVTSSSADEAPLTFGEVAQLRANLYLEIQRVVTVLAGTTLLIAGCSLAIAISGSLVERKRPFTLLRVSGTSIRSLYRAVLMETVSPLIVATAVAAGVGLMLAYPIAKALAPVRHGLALPQAGYYVTLATSLLVAVGVILACLPILGRITHTDAARFE